MKKVAFFIFLIIIIKCNLCLATDTLVVHENKIKLISKQYFQQLADETGKLTIDDILKNNNFQNCKSVLPSIKKSNSALWLKIILQNKTSQPYIPISIGTSIIDHFDLYYIKATRHTIIHIGARDSNLDAGYLTPKTTVINCTILPDSVKTIYLRIQSNSPDIVPIEFNSADKYWENSNSNKTAFGIFTGIVLIMVFYNLLLFFIVKDKSYLYYVSYVIFFSLSQAFIRGYGVNIIDLKALNNALIPTMHILFWISVLIFINEFLQLKKQYKNIYKYYSALYVSSVLPILFIITNSSNTASILLTVNDAINSLVLLFIGVLLYRQGVKHAKFFMIAWGLFLISILISVARNIALLPYNDFTSNVLLFSAVLDLLLFSIALADKINFYRAQTNQSQLFALHIARENEKLITEQNILLENKVLERTKELIENNKNLTGLVNNLKAAQSQLIETEKMASLGQLTAGIAHEINNPINFVRSNINPLKLDFNDVFALLDKYAAVEKKEDHQELLQQAIEFKKKIDLNFIKKEITDLLNGIEEGASRTTEIVQSLRAFSRTDEVELKLADINKSILSTLVLLRNTIPYYIEITPVFDKLKPLNCYPGKLNQVFMNILQNSIQAIKEKKKHSNESILIATKDYPENITIEITDTGTGMTNEVKQRMFDPFFTTKDVGEGTGLGLSIVFGIIEKHHGAIEVKSQKNKGTTFIIMLPKTLN